MEDDINSSTKISSKETKNNQNEIKKLESYIWEKDIKNNKLNNSNNIIEIIIKCL